MTQTEKLRLRLGIKDETQDDLLNMLLEDAQNGIRSSVLCDDETKTLFKTTHTISLGSRNHPNDLAAHLFESLRCFDDRHAKSLCTCFF